jgi:hypothetical protein
VSASASEGLATAFVVLKGGLTMPLEALRLAWALEDRGATFAVDGDDLVVEAAPEFLTEDDRVAITTWRVHLKAIATYQAPETGNESMPTDGET